MIYPIFFRAVGVPVEGLTPVIDIFVKVSDGTSAGTPPTVSELSGGYYKFEYTPIEDVAMRVDGGAALADADRYLSIVASPIDAGPNIVTITVEDDVSSLPVPGATVDLWDSAESYRLDSKTTDANGEVSFDLGDGSYKVRIYKAAAYTFDNPFDLVVSGATQDTYQGTLFSPSAPPSPETCVLYGTTYGAQDQPVSKEVIAELVMPKHFTTSGIQIIKGPISAWSRIEDGYWEMVLTRSVEYITENVVYSIRVGGVVMGEYIIPNQANANLADLAPYTP